MFLSSLLLFTWNPDCTSTKNRNLFLFTFFTGSSILPESFKGPPWKWRPGREWGWETNKSEAGKMVGDALESVQGTLKAGLVNSSCSPKPCFVSRWVKKEEGFWSHAGKKGSDWAHWERKGLSLMGPSSCWLTPSGQRGEFKAELGMRGKRKDRFGLGVSVPSRKWSKNWGARVREYGH